MDASDNSHRYSDLSITTTPDPLSGLVMTMSSHCFNCSMASRSVLEGFCTLRWMTSSVLQIVGLRPPIPSNHHFRDEVQGSSKPSQSSLSLQSTRPVGKGKFQAQTQNQFLEEREIIGRYVLYMLINIRFFVEQPCDLLCVSAHDLLTFFRRM